MASYKRYPPASINVLPETSRSDQQLRTMLHETAQWAVYGPNEQVLCCAASLRHAVERSVEHATSGAIVFALCRLPANDIIIDALQLERLAHPPHMVADDMVGNWLTSLSQNHAEGRRHK
jgi:hypothetical protein